MRDARSGVRCDEPELVIDRSSVISSPSAASPSPRAGPQPPRRPPRPPPNAAAAAATAPAALLPLSPPCAGKMRRASSGGGRGDGRGGGRRGRRGRGLELGLELRLAGVDLGLGDLHLRDGGGGRGHGQRRAGEEHRAARAGLAGAGPDGAEPAELDEAVHVPAAAPAPGAQQAEARRVPGSVARRPVPMRVLAGPALGEGPAVRALRRLQLRLEAVDRASHVRRGELERDPPRRPGVGGLEQARQAAGDVGQPAGGAGLLIQERASGCRWTPARKRAWRPRGRPPRPAPGAARCARRPARRRRR